MKTSIWRFLLLPVLAIALVACGDDGDDSGATHTGTAAAGTQDVTPTALDEEEGPSLADPDLQLTSIEGLSQPAQVVFVGDEDMLVAEKTGAIVRVRNGEVGEPVAELAANYADERGVLGLTLHPDFDENRYVYVYWTWTGEGEPPDGLFGEATDDLERVPENGNRVDRFVWDGENLTFDLNVIELPSRITDLTLDRRRGNHNAGVISFGPDGKLYVVNGDQNERGHLQNVQDGPSPQESGLTGVILRLNDDGSVPGDNPFVALGDPLDKVYLYGLRNSFGYDFDPRSGQLWVEVNGQASYDMLAPYPPGTDVGWIQLMGPADRFAEYKQLESASERALDAKEFPPDRLANTGEEALSRLVLFEGARYSPPVFSWKHAIAPAGLGFVDGTALGEDYDGTLLLGDVNTGHIWMFELTEDRLGLQLSGGLADGVNDNSPEDLVGELADHVFASNILVATDIEQAPDGSVWITSLASGALYHVTRAE